MKKKNRITNKLKKKIVKTPLLLINIIKLYYSQMINTKKKK